MWHIVAHGACLPSPIRPCGGWRRGRLGKAWHPEGEREDVGLASRMVSLPKGVAVRVGDEKYGENHVFGVKMRFFPFGGRCAPRVMGAHQRVDKGLRDKHF